jgi:DNA-binding response OmpR family regulator/anti-sigma regulatory factor (Ser/Thr protein kinase)
MRLRKDVGMMTQATILLVEDDKAMLAGIPELLQFGSADYDLEVLTAENGKLALEIIATHTPDLIISDINMPHMNGIEFLEHLRQNAQWLHIPVIFLTAKGKEEDIHLAKMSGVDLYITKPFNSTELLELVKSQLDRTFQLQASRQQTITSLKGDLLQILNHELNTPLTYVTAYSEMLADTLERFDDLSDSYDFLRGIQVGCMRLTRLVTDFIQVIELRTGEAEANYRQNLQFIEDILPVLQEALYKSEQKNLPHSVPIHFIPPNKSLSLLGHHESLVSAFERLFDNAIKFTFSHKGIKGKVDILVSQTDSDEIQVRITDEGVSFPPHVHQQVFELFYQYNRKEFEQQGIGAGLTIAQGLIDLHNGRIQVESTPGTGSIFTVSLPLYKPGSRPLATTIEPTRKQATILLVEDDGHLLNGLQELLEIYEGKYRLNVLTATNGVEGLEVLAQRRPHLIISDIMMPKMGGLEFLEQVRMIDELVQVPFIFLTAKSERRDILNGIVLGAEEYITKPYDSDRLLDLVVIQLDRYFQQQGLLSQNFESLKRNIVQLMSPDFHSPLQKVAEHSQQVLGKIEGSRSDDELKNSLQHIRQGGQQLNQLVKNFIALAELTTDEARTAFQLQAHTIPDLTQIILTAVTQSAYDMQQDGMEIQQEIPKNLPPIFGVAGTISNCIRNAFKLLKSYYLETTDKTLLLSAYQMDNEVHIAIGIKRQLPPTTAAQIITLLAQERPPKVDLSGHDALWRIIQGHIALHNGRIRTTNDPHFTITLILPIVDK